MLKRLLHAVWLLAVVALLLTAVALTSARLLVPTLAGYHYELERVAGETLGRKVLIGRMQASWRGLQPVLRLRDIVIAAEDPEAADFPLDEIRLRLDLTHYLKHREIRFEGIDVIGADLVLVRDESGTFYLEEFRDLGSGSQADGIAGLALMSRLSLHRSRITFRDEREGGKAQRFSSVMLSLSNDGMKHRLTGHALLPDSVGERLELDALFTGGAMDVRNWQGRVYLKGQQLSLSSLLYYPLPQLASKGTVDLRLWLDVRAGRLVAVSGEFDMRDLHIEHAADDSKHVFSADAMGVRLGWNRGGESWNAVLHLRSAVQSAHSWQPFQLSVAGTSRDRLGHLRISSERLVLDDLWQLLPLVPGVDAERRRELIALQPVGRIEDLDVLLLRSDDDTSLGGLVARFGGLGVAETAAIPAVNGLDGEVSGSEDAGSLLLYSHDLNLTHSRLFRDMLAFSELQGNLHWQRSGEAYRISAKRLAVSNPDLSLLADFMLALPRGESGAELDLHVDIESADVGRTGRYLPAKIMSPDGVAWLDHSLVGGQVRDGKVLIRGRLDQLPFDHGEGVLEVRLPVYNATLDFNDDWTPVTELDAQVDFTGRSMDITSRRGRIRTAALENVRARIGDLANPFLTIDGGVRGQLPVMLAELGSSPLGERFGGFVDQAIADGKCDLQLDIDIPLTESTGSEITAAGRITLDDNSLAIRDTDITVNRIRGELEFDDDGIRGDDLKATLFGRPVSARVRDEEGDTHIHFSGRMALPETLLADGNALHGIVNGEADWQVQLTARGIPVRGKPADVALRISSDLAGMLVDLPPPLGKTAGSARPLSVVVDNAAQPERTVTLNYGDDVKGVLLLGESDGAVKLQRGAISLGDKEPVLPDGQGLLVSGRLAALRLPAWQSRLAAGNAAPDFPVRLDLDVGELELLGHVTRDIHLAATSAGRAWNISVSGEASSGEIELMHTARGIDRVTMNMQRLVLEKTEAGESVLDDRVTPVDMPELHITTAELVYNGTGFGQLDLQAMARADNQYQIERLAISSDLLAMRLEGVWHMTGRNHTSRADLKVTQGNLGRLLEVLGYEKTVKDGALHATLEVAWPGRLWDFSPQILDGRLHLLIKDGQLLDIEPGAPGRALGLLSLAKLPKRLTLDFSDLFDRGFNFERIAGNFVLDNGNAYTNDLEVDGPAAKIEISGRVGLVDEDYDKLVTVTPYLDSSLPLAGVLAGGPAVGAAVIVAEKLLEGKLGFNKLARKQYTVTGPWSAPVVTRVDLDTGQDAAGVNILDD